MRELLRVSDVRFSPAPDRLVSTGLIGWVSFLIDSRIQVERVAVRRTRNGRVVLSYPARDDGWGNRFTFVHPIDDATRREIERQVIERLGAQEVLQ